MKKFIFTLVSFFAAVCMSFAQDSGDMVTQPTQVIARRINANGEITSELVSEFSYNENGKLSQYDFPNYALSANFVYDGDFLTYEHIIHEAGYPIIHEMNQYTYENGLIKTISHAMDNMGSSLQWEYTYDEWGRLERKDKKDMDTPNAESHEHWLYEYPQDGNTVIESYCTSWTTQGWKLREQTTSQYDDGFKLSSVLVEKYNISGELTSTTITNYDYNSSDKLEKKTTQTLHDGIWENTFITQYTYNEGAQIAEQLDGSWNDENGEWNFTHKIAFDYSEDGQKYTVSFFKKSGDNWVWDTFNRETFLFQPYLKPQQMMLNYLEYEEYNGEGHINQFEITLEYTNKPIYMSLEEKTKPTFCVYPNPGCEKININTPVENAVIRLYDIQGKLMLARPFNFNTTINTENWPAGMYLWEIWHEAQRETSGKWIKE